VRRRGERAAVRPVAGDDGSHGHVRPGKTPDGLDQHIKALLRGESAYSPDTQRPVAERDGRPLIDAVGDDPDKPLGKPDLVAELPASLLRHGDQESEPPVGAAEDSLLRRAADLRADV
jgi:hypothetical protein